MPFANSNDFITGRKPLRTPQGAEVVAARFEIDLLTTDLVINDIGVVGMLPAGTVPVALYYDSDDLDINATPTVAASVGILNATDTALSTATADCGAVWGSGILTSQAGGQSAVVSKALSRVTSTAADRKIGVLFTAAAATAVAGKLGLTMLYRNAA